MAKVRWKGQQGQAIALLIRSERLTKVLKEAGLVALVLDAMGEGVLTPTSAELIAVAQGRLKVAGIGPKRIEKLAQALTAQGYSLATKEEIGGLDT